MSSWDRNCWTELAVAHFSSYRYWVSMPDLRIPFCFTETGSLFPPSQGMVGACVLTSFSFFGKNGNNSTFAIVGLSLYLSFFSVGMGPGAWLIPSEVFATSIRAKAMSLATFFNRITATLMASTFLSTANGTCQLKRGHDLFDFYIRKTNPLSLSF